MAKSNVVKLPEKLDISGVEALFREFRDLVEKGGSVRLDASRVKRADTAGMQLLYSLQKTLAEQGAKAAVADPSEDFMTCVRLTGFDKVLAFNQ
ncbi:MAG: STAS domain-containing protein [Ketobacteraceae bacterium]|nr:STAS domain-containing protein [Ketobacteraceae bacterium]